MPTTHVTEITASVDTVSDRTDSAGAAVNPDWKAEERRMALKMFSGGIVAPKDGWKVVAGAGGTMNIIVGSGATESDLVLVEGTVAGQGNYLMRLDEPGKTIALGASDPSNARIDGVYAVVYDNTYDASARTLPRIVVRRGDPASSPSSPGPDAAWTAYELLSEITIPAGAADITQATVADRRRFSNLNLAGSAGVPTGTILAFAGSVLPDGFYWCRAETKSRTTDARLFSIIGTAYGAGDGSTTFTLPNLQQRFPLGKAVSGTGSALGNSGGAIDHTHTTPSHTHTGPAHVHAVSLNSAAEGAHAHSVNGTSQNGGSHTHDIDFAGGSGAAGHTGTSLRHDIVLGSQMTTEPNHNHTVSINSDTESDHSHVVSGNTSSSGTANTGGAAPTTNDNNPPYQVVNYIIKN